MYIFMPLTGFHPDQAEGREQNKVIGAVRVHMGIFSHVRVCVCSYWERMLTLITGGLGT